jgi:hypothetical protein
LLCGTQPTVVGVRALVVALVVAGCGFDTVVPHVLVAIHVDMIFMAASRAFKGKSMSVSSVKDVLGDGILSGGAGGNRTT